MSKVPRLFWLVLAAMTMAMTVKALKWFFGAGYDVREPLDWVFVATAALAVALALGAGVRGLVRVGRRQYYPPLPGEAPDGPRRRTITSSVSMLLIPLIGVSSIMGTLAATDGSDPHGAGPLDWGVIVLMPLSIVVVLGLGMWTLVKLSK
ncbi:hypothetical protein [Streptosporangium roseum]|uniref:hypothetical protein n=1 Tax=Streptosporangium roseum TaxID=2001 RepID=UPI0004CDB4AD|nr:hypothetical protein [Streptosporangium roseum]